MRCHRLIAILALTAMAALAPRVTDARIAAASKEYQLKAAFIYNFTQFVEWAEDSFANADAPLVVAVIGDDPFGDALQQALAGKSVGTRRIVVRNFATVEQVTACHLLFVPAPQTASLPAILRKLHGASTLTVGENEDFTAAGGGMSFYLENNRLRFEVNLTATDLARLKISSKLLKLARVVTK